MSRRENGINRVWTLWDRGLKSREINQIRDQDREIPQAAKKESNDFELYLLNLLKHQPYISQIVRNPDLIQDLYTKDLRATFDPQAFLSYFNAVLCIPDVWIEAKLAKRGSVAYKNELRGRFNLRGNGLENWLMKNRQIILIRGYEDGQTLHYFDTRVSQINNYYLGLTE